MKNSICALSLVVCFAACSTIESNKFVDKESPIDTKPYILDKNGTAQWKLVFSDEFNDNVVDTTKWLVLDQDKGYKNGIKRYFRKHNISENDGYLEVKYQHEGDSTYTSGKIETSIMYSEQYGFFECRMKSVRANGHQMAFWMMPVSGDGMSTILDGTANDGAEIDIVETCRSSDEYSCGLHWDGYSKGHKSNGKIVRASGLHNNGFNTYALEWSPEYLKFYFNGKVVRTMTDSILIPHVKEHIILSGCCFADGWADGDIRDNKALPDTSLIDYVRVFKLNVNK